MLMLLQLGELWRTNSTWYCEFIVGYRRTFQANWNGAERNKSQIQKAIPLDEEVHYWVQKGVVQITSARYQKFCMIEYSKIEQLEKKAIDKPVTETRTAKPHQVKLKAYS